MKEPSERQKNTIINIAPVQYEALEDLTRITGKSKGEIIRVAIDRYLQAGAPSLPIDKEVEEKPVLKPKHINIIIKQDNALQKLRRKTGKSKGKMIREAIDMYLKNELRLSINEQFKKIDK